MHALRERRYINGEFGDHLRYVSYFLAPASRKAYLAYLSIDHPDEIAEAFATLGQGPDDVDLIVCTDAESILGIGDWGVGGIQITAGKLALYTAGGGIDPRRTIAVSLDVGTDNEQLLNDPFYVGNRHPRRRGAEYDEFIDRYVQTAHRLFPHAMLHFEDFGAANARAILDRYSSQYCVFNDDVQGTGAVVMAALYAGLKVTGVPMTEQTVVVFGAGSAGIGIADQFCDAMIGAGATAEQAAARIWPIDKQGLLFDDMDGLYEFQRPYAKNRQQLGFTADQRVGLLETIKLAAPTILLGCASVPGAFTREVVEAMVAGTACPLVFPISNPTSRMEATAADVITWSKGRALVATGSPSPPVQYDGITSTISQANNVLTFPGIGLGVAMSGATRVTNRMLDAAAKAVAHQSDPTTLGAGLLPSVTDLPAISAAVTEAVYDAAVADGVARKAHDDVSRAIEDSRWHPSYDD
jgi:malate dehydrogenase (oxaloacetate-decarboxylating)